MRDSYPFVPKSTSYLEQGQFWALPLSDGSFAAGIVISLVTEGGKRDSRMFLAGLLDWFGDEPPTLTGLSLSKVIDIGYAHIKTISESGGVVLGISNIELQNPSIAEYTDVIPTWGYNSILQKAERVPRAS